MISQAATGDISPEFPSVGVRAANLLRARRSEEDGPPYSSRRCAMKSFTYNLFVCSSGLFDGVENERSFITKVKRDMLLNWHLNSSFRVIETENHR